MSIDSITQPAIACSKLSIETQEQGVKYVQIRNYVCFNMNF